MFNKSDYSQDAYAYADKKVQAWIDNSDIAVDDIAMNPELLVEAGEIRIAALREFGKKR